MPRQRGSAQPRIQAYREVGWQSRTDNAAYINGCRLERRSEIRDRIGYLVHLEENLITEKRQLIEQRLWAMHASNIADYFERYDEIATDKQGNIEVDENNAPKLRTRERPRLLTDLPSELAALIEDVQVDSKGRVIPKLYNKLQANRELRAMLDIGKPMEASDVTRLSDQELIAQLAQTAAELGVKVDLNFRFAQQQKEPDKQTPPTTEGPGAGSQGQ